MSRRINFNVIMDAGSPKSQLDESTHCTLRVDIHGKQFAGQLCGICHHDTTVVYDDIVLALGGMTQCETFDKWAAPLGPNAGSNMHICGKQHAHVTMRQHLWILPHRPVKNRSKDGSHRQSQGLSLYNTSLLTLGFKKSRTAAIHVHLTCKNDESA